MGALSSERILTLHAALVSADLGEKRPALLAGLDAMLVLGIARAPDAAGQLLVDLHTRTAPRSPTGPRRWRTSCGTRWRWQRLTLATSDPTAARHHLAAARAIITATGYHRRDAELAALEAQAPPTPAPPPD